MLPKFNKDVADFFLKKAKLDKDNDSLVVFCLEKALTFITDEENLKMIANWIREGKIKIEGEELACALSVDHKY